MGQVRNDQMENQLNNVKKDQQIKNIAERLEQELKNVATKEKELKELNDKLGSLNNQILSLQSRLAQSQSDLVEERKFREKVIKTAYGTTGLVACAGAGYLAYKGYKRYFGKQTSAEASAVSE